MNILHSLNLRVKGFSLNNQAKTGFTLMEVLIAVSIIAVLTAIGIVSYGSINKRSRDVKRRSDLESVRSALELYRSDSGFYPAGCGGGWVPLNAACLDTALVEAGYISALPTDPKGVSYGFQVTDLDPITSNYFGYCLQTKLENEDDATISCPIEGGSDNNHTVKNP